MCVCTKVIQIPPGMKIEETCYVVVVNVISADRISNEKEKKKANPAKTPTQLFYN